jgi:putative MFS transporter
LPSDIAAAQAISARIERLPPVRAVWNIVILLALPGIFEIYDLAHTAYLPPAMIREGLLTPSGLFGSPQATFAASTFLGLFVGASMLGHVADAYGRRQVFVGALLLYSAGTFVLAFQTSAAGIYACRFVASVGIGIEMVTADAYLVELVPASIRGKAFALTHVIVYVANPLVAVLSFLLVPLAPLGFAGWRWVALIGCLGAVVIWWIRLGIPESPRWLALKGRHVEADAVTRRLEDRVRAETRGALPEPSAGVPQIVDRSSLRDIFRPPYRRRTVMLAVFNFFQTVGFFGFANWMPTLLEAQGVTFTHSLLYSSIIAIAYPLSPLLWMMVVADRFERKWMIVTAATGVAICGALFSRQSSPVALVSLGILITSFNTLLSLSYHPYQAELYPTAIRARAVGFVYSFSRLSTVLTSFIIGGLLGAFGPAGVFTFITGSMAVVVAVIGLLGPLTRNRTLEEISK